MAKTENGGENRSKKSPHRNLTEKELVARKKAARIKKKKKKRRIILLITTLLICLIAILIVSGFSSLNKIKRTKLNDDNLGISDKFNKNSSNYSDVFDDIVNIALYGVDEESYDTQRSDSIMIGTLDNTHKKLKITTLMRDTYVNIPGHGYDKLNHAYAYGGPQLSISTINKNFDLNITDYVAVDFGELESIVNAIGGVTMDLSDEDINVLNEYLDYVYTFNKEPVKKVKRSSDGLVHLNGFEALSYGRNRSTPDGDFGRTQRQRNLMEAMFQKISSFGTAKLASTMTKLLPYVETSLTNSEILTLGTQVLSLGNLSIEQARFPRDDYSENSLINDIFYFTFDEDIARREIYEYLFKDKKIWETQ